MLLLFFCFRILLKYFGPLHKFRKAPPLIIMLLLISIWIMGLTASNIVMFVKSIIEPLLFTVNCHVPFSPIICFHGKPCIDIYTHAHFILNYTWRLVAIDFFFTCFLHCLIAVWSYCWHWFEDPSKTTRLCFRRGMCIWHFVRTWRSICHVFLTGMYIKHHIAVWECSWCWRCNLLSRWLQIWWFSITS